MAEHLCHVQRDHTVDREQVGEIETAEAVCIPPGKNEIGRPPGLVRVVTGDLQDPLKSRARCFIHVRCS
jgi:hypothetical protein